MKLTKILFFLNFFVLFFLQNNFAQSVDSLFNVAKIYAFKHNTNQARIICKQILKINPGYTDAILLRGRTYSWDSYYDSAKVELNKAFKIQPSYQDVSLALIDNEMWSGDFEEALHQADKSLELFPDSIQILWRKARILEQLKEIDSALEIMERLIERQAENEEYIRYYNELKISTFQNKIGIDYTFDYYNEPYLRKTHIFSLNYILKLPKLTIIPKLNTGHLVSEETDFLEDKDVQSEIDLYLSITKKSYVFLTLGFAGSTFFPKQKFGLEYYTGLPFATEASIGYRYLQYLTPLNEQVNISIYNISFGKYIGNYLFSLKSFITPIDKEISQTHILTIRKYFSKPENYLSLTLASGNAPDDPTRNITQIQVFRLKSYNLRIGFQYRLSTRISSHLSLGYAREEYLNTLNRNSFNSTLSLYFNF